MSKWTGDVGLLLEWNFYCLFQFCCFVLCTAIPFYFRQKAFTQGLGARGWTCCQHGFSQFNDRWISFSIQCWW